MYVDNDPLSRDHLRSQQLRPWDPTTIAVSSKAISLVEEAVEDQFQARKTRLSSVGIKARRSRGDNGRKEFASVAALVLDPLASFLCRDSRPIRISLDKNWLTSGPLDQPARNGTINDRLHDLSEAGWVKSAIGRPVQGLILSTIAPGPKAITRAKEIGLTLGDIGCAQSAHAVELKGEPLSPQDKRRPRLTVPSSPEVEAIARRVRQLQTHIWQAELATSPEAPVVIDTRRRHFWRSFLDGRFDRGGRLGGPAFWLSLRKDIRRRYLRISGEPIVEVDVNASIPRVAYALNGAMPDADPYAVPELAGVDRGAIKIVLLQLFWSPLSSATRLPSEPRAAIPASMSAKEVYEAVLRHNAPIADLLGAKQPIGAELLYRESEYLIEACLRAYSSKITALPLHDAMLVPESRAEEAREILSRAFHDEMGFPAVVTVKRFDERRANDAA